MVVFIPWSFTRHVRNDLNPEAVGIEQSLTEIQAIASLTGTGTNVTEVWENRIKWSKIMFKNCYLVVIYILSYTHWIPSNQWLDAVGYWSNHSNEPLDVFLFVLCKCNFRQDTLVASRTGSWPMGQSSMKLLMNRFLGCWHDMLGQFVFG